MMKYQHLAEKLLRSIDYEIQPSCGVTEREQFPCYELFSLTGMVPATTCAVNAV